MIDKTLDYLNDVIDTLQGKKGEDDMATVDYEEVGALVISDGRSTEAKN